MSIPSASTVAIFNFADNMLVLGAVILVLFALRPEAPVVSGPPQSLRSRLPRL